MFVHVAARLAAACVILVMQQVRERSKRESAGRVETMGDRGGEVKDGESLESLPPTKDNSPLFKRMTAVMHVIIFLYSAAFWVQTNVFPVGVHTMYVCLCTVVCCTYIRNIPSTVHACHQCYSQV